MGDIIVLTEKCSENGCERLVVHRGQRCLLHNMHVQRKSKGRRNRLKRARRNGKFEPIKKRVVYERDNWICGFCGEGIDPRLVWPDPMSASLDHILPISRGGPHNYANVQASHLDCNTRAREKLNMLGLNGNGKAEDLATPRNG